MSLRISYKTQNVQRQKKTNNQSSLIKFYKPEQCSDEIPIAGYVKND